jgi:chromosome segregation ATPase
MLVPSLWKTDQNKCDPEHPEAARQQAGPGSTAPHPAGTVPDERQGIAGQQEESPTTFEKFKQAMADFYGRLAGHAVEKDLADYSEVYGEILLGMHRDMERHQALINEHDQNMRQGVARVSEVQAQLSQAVAKAEEARKNACSLSEQAESAALAAAVSAKELKKHLDETKAFVLEARREWQALLATVDSQRDEIRTLDLTLKRFRARVKWSTAALALVVIIGGLAWMVHFFR